MQVTKSKDGLLRYTVNIAFRAGRILSYAALLGYFRIYNNTPIPTCKIAAIKIIKKSLKEHGLFCLYKYTEWEQEDSDIAAKCQTIVDRWFKELAE